MGSLAGVGRTRQSMRSCEGLSQPLGASAAGRRRCAGTRMAGMCQVRLSHGNCRRSRNGGEAFQGSCMRRDFRRAAFKWSSNPGQTRGQVLEATSEQHSFSTVKLSIHGSSAKASLCLLFLSEESRKHLAGRKEKRDSVGARKPRFKQTSTQTSQKVSRKSR